MVEILLLIAAVILFASASWRGRKSAPLVPLGLTALSLALLVAVQTAFPGVK